MTTNIWPTFHDCGTVYHTDLLTLCGELARRGMRVDMALMDLPYGTTQNEWDVIIPFPEMWKMLNRIVKPNGAMVFTASQPFTTLLIASNLQRFKYCWVVEKQQPTGFLDARRKPLKAHEDIAVFYQNQPTYNPQDTKPVHINNERKNKAGNGNYGRVKSGLYVQETGNFPRSVLKFDWPTQDQLHPTQKPVDLFRYLIRTYTRPGEVVADFCVGSGTTAIAAREEGRRFIVGDSSAEYVQVTRDRLDTPYTPSFLPALESASA